MGPEGSEPRLVVHVDLVDRRVRVRGELDVATAELLVEQMLPLAAAGSGRVAVDMTDVDFCDSSGLNALLILRRRLAETGQRLQVVAASVQVRRLFELTGLTDLADEPDHPS